MVKNQIYVKTREEGRKREREREREIEREKERICQFFLLSCIYDRYTVTNIHDKIGFKFHK